MIKRVDWIHTNQNVERLKTSQIQARKGITRILIFYLYSRIYQVLSSLHVKMI